MRYFFIFLFLCSNTFAENFSIQCKSGSYNSKWGDSGNDIWFIKEKDKDVCSFSKKVNLANCWGYNNEKFKGDEITFYNWGGGEKFILNRVTAEIRYFYKDPDSWIKKWKYGHYYTCRKINFIPQKFYTYENYLKDKAIRDYERNRRKF